jgi:ankyrin repeat protein
MQYEGKSALHMAAETGHTQVVQLLLNLQPNNNLRRQASDTGDVAAATAQSYQGS